MRDGGLEIEEVVGGVIRDCTSCVSDESDELKKGGGLQNEVVVRCYAWWAKIVRETVGSEDVGIAALTPD